MRYKLHQRIKTARVRKLFVAALAMGCALGTVAQGNAQTIASSIPPPEGNVAFLVGHAARYSRLCLSALGRRRFLDCQQPSPRSDPFSDGLRSAGSDHYAFPQPQHESHGSLRKRCHLLMQPGRVLSIAARFGRKR